MREIGMFLVVLERSLADQRPMSAIGRVHRLVALRGGEFVSLGGLANRYSAGDPRCSAGAKSVGVEALRGANAPGALAPVAEKHCDRIIGMPGLNPNRARNFLPVQLKLDHIFGLDALLLRHPG